MNRFCPNCHHSISVWQAEFAGKKKCFPCKSCNTNIQNEAQVAWVGSLGFVAMFLSYQKYGLLSLEFLVSFIVICIFILTHSYFGAKIILYKENNE